MEPGDLVCVTGASGFVASWLVRDLLARGQRVRGTVRNPSGASHLTALPGAAERLELVAADLLDRASLVAAVAGCRVVFHTASPYVINVSDPQRDLIDPAVQGTEHVLSACAQTPGIARVVLTSSMAAVTDEPDATRVLTEADWNEKSTLARNPYYLSKTMAERAAWSFMEGRERRAFDLVALNPFVIMGPALGPGLNVSNQIVADIINGVYPAIVGLTWGIVDVRDVADAHVRAASVPGAHGRYLLATDPVSMRTVVGWLRDEGYAKGTKLPSRPLDNAVGNLLVRLNSYLQPAGTGSYLRTHIGRAPRYDTSKARTELGMTFRPTRETILDTARDLERRGDITRSGRSG